MTSANTTHMWIAPLVPVGRKEGKRWVIIMIIIFPKNAISY